MTTKVDKYALPNYRQIKVMYIPHTARRGERIKIWEMGRGHHSPTESKIFSYDYDQNNALEQGLSILLKNGFHPVARASERDYNVILCDDFGDNFKHINNLT